MGRMHETKPHADVLRLWGGPTALARAVGLEPAVVKMWFSRGRIPAQHWLKVAEAARDAGLDVSVETLARPLSEVAAT